MQKILTSRAKLCQKLVPIALQEDHGLTQTRLFLELLLLLPLSHFTSQLPMWVLPKCIPRMSCALCEEGVASVLHAQLEELDPCWASARLVATAPAAVTLAALSATWPYAVAGR